MFKRQLTLHLRHVRVGGRLKGIPRRCVLGSNWMELPFVPPSGAVLSINWQYVRPTHVQELDRCKYALHAIAILHSPHPVIALADRFSPSPSMSTLTASHPSSSAGARFSSGTYRLLPKSQDLGRYWQLPLRPPVCTINMKTPCSHVHSAHQHDDQALPYATPCCC